MTQSPTHPATLLGNPTPTMEPDRLRSHQTLAEMATAAALGHTGPGCVYAGARSLGAELATRPRDRPSALATNGVYVAAAHGRVATVYHPVSLEEHRQFEFDDIVIDVALHQGFTLMVAVDDRLFARPLIGGSRLVISEWADGGVYRTESPIVAVASVGDRLAVLTENGLEVLDAFGRIAAEHPCEPGPMAQWDNTIAVVGDGDVHTFDLVTGEHRSIDIDGLSVQTVAIGPDHIYVTGVRDGRCQLERYSRRYMHRDGTLLLSRPARGLSVTHRHTYMFDGEEVLQVRHGDQPTNVNGVDFTISPDQEGYGADKHPGMTITRVDKGEWRVRLPRANWPERTIPVPVLGRVPKGAVVIARAELAGDELTVETRDVEHWGVDCTVHVSLKGNPTLTANPGRPVHFDGPVCADLNAAYGHTNGQLRAVSLGEPGFLGIIDFDNGRGPGVPVSIAQ